MTSRRQPQLLVFLWGWLFTLAGIFTYITVGQHTPAAVRVVWAVLYSVPIALFVALPQYFIFHATRRFVSRRQAVLAATFPKLWIGLILGVVIIAVGIRYLQTRPERVFRSLFQIPVTSGTTVDRCGRTLGMDHEVWVFRTQIRSDQILTILQDAGFHPERIEKPKRWSWQVAEMLDLHVTFTNGWSALSRATETSTSTVILQDDGHDAFFFHASH